MTVLSSFMYGIDGVKWYVVVLAVVAYGLKVYREYARLRHINGPFLCGWSHLWYVRAVASFQLYADLERVCKKYGSVVRIAPNLLITSSPEILWRMNAARSPYTKGPWYKGAQMPPGEDNIFSLLGEKEHGLRRAQMADGYSGKTNLFLEGTVDTQVLNLVKLIRAKYISTRKDFKPMDLASKASFLTMDVITDLAFAKPFGNLENDEDTYKYIEATEDGVRSLIVMSSIPSINAIISIGWLGKLLFPSEKSKTGIGKMTGIARKLVHERYVDKGISRQDMTSSFIAHGLSERELMAECLVQLLVGSDSTATAIRATLLHVITRPSVYTALQAEIDENFRQGRISRPVVKEAEAQRMPYLQAVIREGLRIWPPAPGLFSKVVPPQGDEVDVDGKKLYIPGGTNIGYCPWGVHRNKDVFGEDADMFRPERWLIEDGKELARMHKTADLVWGYGKYQCLGKPVALLELNKTFVEVSRLIGQAADLGMGVRCDLH